MVTCVSRLQLPLEAGLRVATLVGADDEVLVAVERLPRSDEVVKPMMVAAEPVQDQNGVFLGCVNLAVSDINDRVSILRTHALSSVFNSFKKRQSVP